MKKVLLFFLIIAGIAFLEPRSRAQIMKLAGPASETSRQQKTERALERMAIDVQKTADEVGLYPQPDVFDQWLMQTYRSAQDPWGSEFYFEIYIDSFVVGSPGPDSTRRTTDDLRLTTRRGRTAAAASGASTAGSSYSPPAPPASGVKNSAIQKAQQATRTPR